MTNQEMLQIAMRQSAIDCNARLEDFSASVHRVVRSVPHPDARRYLKLPFFCDLVSYGDNVVASVDARAEAAVKAYLSRMTLPYRAFETPQIHLLTDAFARYGQTTCWMAEYFLPDVRVLKALPCPYPTRLMHAADFAPLYASNHWHNALCADRKELDVLGMAAFDGDELIGLAACSADCDTMWQIGVDVLPEYRRQGVASALTSWLALAILARGKVPFYCAAWSNVRSVRNAMRSGFRPAWVELTAIDTGKAMAGLAPLISEG